MNLFTRCNLIDDMIRENPDVTIKDYMELVAELSGIKNCSDEVIIPALKAKPRKKKPYVDAKYLNNYRVHFK